jgi:hypothetical protein
MTISWDADQGTLGLLFGKRRIDNICSALPQPCDDSVIVEASPMKIITTRSDIRDERRDAIFILGELHSGDHRSDIEFNVIMADSLLIGSDEQPIGGRVLEPFSQPEAWPLVACAFECDSTILDPIVRPQSQPMGLAGSSLGMSGKSHENEKPRLPADQRIKETRLQFAQELLWSISAEPEIENPLLAVEQIRENLRQCVGIAHAHAERK